MLRLLIKRSDADGRENILRDALTTEWSFDIVDSNNRPALTAALAQADAMISMNWPADMPAAPRLRLLQLPGAGLDEVAFDHLPPNAHVCNTFEHQYSIAEYVLAGMLEWNIRLADLQRRFRDQHDWHGAFFRGPIHGELYRKTAGILGYGRIGKEVARRCAAFDMRVIACSRTAQVDDPFAERVDGMAALPALLGEADYVINTLPLDDTTRGLIDHAAFAAMKKTALVVNVGRGATIDEAALFEALQTRRIGGAVIDVWYQYPRENEPNVRPSRFPFEELDNLIMTPHASAWSDGLLPRRWSHIAHNLDRLARGEPLLNIVHQPNESSSVY